MASEQTDCQARPFADEGRRVVLLITTPVGESFQSIAKATGFRADKHGPIEWSSSQNTSLPTLASRLRFTTHYALCVMDSDIWDDTSASLLEKFRSGRFWDHPGDLTLAAPSGSSQSNSSTIPARLNACCAWRDVDIRSIDSGEAIGRTDMSNEDITRDYMELRRDWPYMPILWNCHDLAIRLAYIIIQPSVDVKTILTKLMVSLRRAGDNELPSLALTVGKVGVSGWSLSLVGGLTCVPPLAVAGCSVFMFGMCSGVLGGFQRNMKIRSRDVFMVRLEEKFPQLMSLHH